MFGAAWDGPSLMDTWNVAIRLPPRSEPQDVAGPQCEPQPTGEASL